MSKRAMFAVLVVLAALAAAPSSAQAATGVPCTSAFLGSAMVASPAGSAFQFGASSTGCLTPEYRYFLQPPGGSWTPQTSYLPETTWTWQTTHSTPLGVWGIGVWAREQGSTAPYEAWFIGTVTLLTDACTATTLQVNGNPTLGYGQWGLIANTNCASAQYRFWMLPPGGSWTILQDWQAANTYTFDTTGRAAGTYLLGVWVRNPLSASAYESYAISTVVVGSCQAALLDTSMQNPAKDGTTVSVSAATVVGSPCQLGQIYQFWLLTPNGWTVEQPYSTQGWWNWDTSSVGPGTYEVGLWAKSATSTAAYDGYFIATVTLLPSACDSGSVSSSVPSPQTPGTSVTFQASGCGGGGWVQWWVLAPGSSSWTVLQNYTYFNQFIAPNYVWNTTGLTPGPYRIGIWLANTRPLIGYTRPPYDTYAITTFWVGT